MLLRRRRQWSKAARLFQRIFHETVCRASARGGGAAVTQGTNPARGFAPASCTIALPGLFMSRPSAPGAATHGRALFEEHAPFLSSCPVDAPRPGLGGALRRRVWRADGMGWDVGMRRTLVRMGRILTHH